MASMSRRRQPPPDALAALARRDPALGEVMERVPPFPAFPDPRRGGTHFHALARAILYQQLATKAAATIHGRVNLGIREGVRRLDGLVERPPPAVVEARGEVWRPLRSVASWVLWRLLDEETPGTG